MTLPHIVHIGHHKTGTTYFQSLVYPRALSGRYVDRETVRELFVEPRALAFDAEHAREALGLDLDGAPRERLFLCEEELSGHVLNGGCHGLVGKETASRLMQAFGGSAHVVIFVREQVSALASTYSQYVKAGGVRSPRGFLAAEDTFRIPGFSLDHFAWDRLVGHYLELFGRDHVHVYAYEDFARDNAGFTGRYAEAHGLDLDGPTPESARLNTALRLRALHYKRFCNLFQRARTGNTHHLCHLPMLYRLLWSDPVVRALHRMDGTRITPEGLFDPRTLAALRDRFSDSNARLQAMTGLDLGAWGYAMP